MFRLWTLDFLTTAYFKYLWMSLLTVADVVFRDNVILLKRLSTLFMLPDVLIFAGWQIFINFSAWFWNNLEAFLSYKMLYILFLEMIILFSLHTLIISANEKLPLESSKTQPAVKLLIYWENKYYYSNKA